MFQNYFKTAFRNLWKDKLTTIVNFVGLSAGMITAVFIFLWVQNQMSFDNYHNDLKDIYRITNSIQVNKDESWKWESSPGPMAEAVLKEVPEAKQEARLSTPYQPVVTVDHKLFTEKSSAYVDKSWFKIFNYHFLQGSAADFAQDPFAMILTQSKAKKYFGNTNPVGQVVKVDTVNYTVRGVVKDDPLNSSFRFDVIMQLEGSLASRRAHSHNNGWNNYNYIIFLKLDPHSDVLRVEKKINEIVNKNRTTHNDKVSLLPLKDMYFESDLQASRLPHGNKNVTYIFSLLGLLLLVIACINYVNLTTARASLRAKEVSIKKMIGAGRSHLFMQFLAESFTTSFIALVITLLLVKLCVPLFTSITGENFQLPFTSLTLWKVLAGTLLVALFLNGIYPALLLSSFKPLNVLRGRNVLKLRDGFIRKGLVIFQFMLSMVLIVGAMVMYRQMRFIQTSNPGYKISQIISLQVPFPSNLRWSDSARRSFYSSVRNELESQSGIAAVSTAGDDIVNIGSSSSGNADWDGRDSTFNPTIAVFSADADFQKMFQLKMNKGRWFRPGNEDKHNVIINETAEKDFNMHKPTIGQRFTWGGDTGVVVGVVKDFHYKSMHDKIGPLVVQYNGGSDYSFFIKTVPGNISGALNAAKKTWSSFVKDRPFEYHFLDDTFNNLYKSDIKALRLIFVFSVIAVIISALGLFALAAFTAEQRTKEIGIRKVLGASVRELATMLSKEFIKLVLIAILIATPITWWAVHSWLMDFAYRIHPGVLIFSFGGLIALLIAVASVSAQAIKAARANPVESLRTE